MSAAQSPSADEPTRVRTIEVFGIGRIAAVADACRLRITARQGGGKAPRQKKRERRGGRERNVAEESTKRGYELTLCLSFSAADLTPSTPCKRPHSFWKSTVRLSTFPSEPQIPRASEPQSLKSLKSLKSLRASVPQEP